MNTLLHKVGAAIVALMFVSSAFAQITITPIAPVSAVQNVLLGAGVTVSNVVYTGANVAVGKFVSNTQSMPFASGIVMSTGLASEVNGGSSDLASSPNGQGSNPLLEALVTDVVKDASVLEFDFVPESDTIRFRYIFASEEYPEYSDSDYNDIFGFFLSGPNPMGGNYINKNIALLPGSNTTVSIANVSDLNNVQYYVDNSSSSTLVYDGRTVVLTAWALVNPCISYHIKMAIADVGDDDYDSGVFLEAYSFSSPRVTVSSEYSTNLISGNAIEGCTDVKLSVKLPFVETYDRWISYYFSGTATPSTDYTVDYVNPDDPTYLNIPAGQDSLVINVHPIMDNVTEPTETILFVINSSRCNSNILDTVIMNIVNRDSLSLSVYGDTLVCNGDSAHLLAQVSGGLEPLQYLWSNNYNQLNQTLIPTDSVTTYVFSVTDLCGFHQSDSVTVVNSMAGISVMNDAFICEGDSIMLNGSGTSAVVWTNLTGEAPFVAPIQTTQYEATVSSNCGVAKDTVTIVVDKIPYFSLGHDTIVCESHPISIGIPYMENGVFLWSSGNTASEITTNSPNTYVLNVTRGVCSYSDTIVLNPGFCDWWIPNAFSPDHTNINEVFKPVGVPIQQYELIIFDRWGEVVFRTNDWNEGWDGTYQNQKMPIGVYVYQLFGEASASKIKGLVKQGQVTLVR